MTSHLTLASPSSSELQRAIDAGTGDRPVRIVVEGVLSMAARVILRSYLELDLRRARVIPSFGGLPDDPSNALFMGAPMIDALQPPTATTTATAIGATVLDVVSTEGIVAGDFVLIAGNNLILDLFGENGVTAGIFEAIEVTAVTATTVTLREPTMQFYQSGTAVRAIDVTRDVTILGGVLDGATGIATGIAGFSMQNLCWEGGTGRNFSRAAFEVGGGTRGWQVRDYYRDGNTNCDVLAVSAHGGLVKGLRCNPGGQRFHPLGIPRACIAFRQRASGNVVADCNIEGTSQGIQLYGGLCNSFSNINIRNTDPTERAARIGPGNLDGFLGGGRMGSAVDSGPVDPAAGISEFSYGTRWTGITCERVVTPVNGNVSAAAAYLHDEFAGTVSSINVINLADAGAQRGLVISDWSGRIENVFVRGIGGFGIAFDNGPYTVSLRGVYLEGSGGSGGASTAPALQFGCRQSYILLDDVAIGNLNSLAQFTSAYVDDNELRIRNLFANGFVTDEARVVRNTGGINHDNGRIVQLTATPWRIIAPGPGGASTRILSVVKFPLDNISSGDPLTLGNFFAGICAHGKRSYVRASAGAVAVGDIMEHVLIGEAAPNPLAVFNTSLGTAATSKAGGAAGLVALI